MAARNCHSVHLLMVWVCLPAGCGPRALGRDGCCRAGTFGSLVWPAWAGRCLGCLKPQEHSVESDQAQCLAVQLPHLGEHVGLLDTLDDPAVVDADVVEEAGP